MKTLKFLSFGWGLFFVLSYKQIFKFIYLLGSDIAYLVIPTLSILFLYWISKRSGVASNQLKNTLYVLFPLAYFATTYWRNIQFLAENGVWVFADVLFLTMIGLAIFMIIEPLRRSTE